MSIEIKIKKSQWKVIEQISQELATHNKLLKRIADTLDPRFERFLFYTVDENEKQTPIKGGTMFIKATESKKFAIRPVDAKQNTAKVDGAPVWAVTDPSLFDVVVAEDGLSADVTPKGPLGACELQVKGDADLGEGVTDVFGKLDLEVIAGDAVAIEIAPV